MQHTPSQGSRPRQCGSLHQSPPPGRLGCRPCAGQTRRTPTTERESESESEWMVLVWRGGERARGCPERISRDCVHTNTANSSLGTHTLPTTHLVEVRRVHQRAARVEADRRGVEVNDGAAVEEVPGKSQPHVCAVSGLEGLRCAQLDIADLTLPARQGVPEEVAPGSRSLLGGPRGRGLLLPPARVFVSHRTVEQSVTGTARRWYEPVRNRIV